MYESVVTKNTNIEKRRDKNKTKVETVAQGKVGGLEDMFWGKYSRSLRKEVLGA